jgi:cyclophilin family peptidyl-prolyl cis-trans isomerase
VNPSTNVTIAWALLRATVATLLVATVGPLQIRAQAESPEPASPPDSTSVPVVTHVATFVTSLGAIDMELYGEDAPRTVANIVGLIQEDYYNGVLFHAIVPGFYIQAGDPKTRDTTLRREWGTGGTSIYGGPFADELNPETPSYRRGYRKGTVAMANSGPNSNRSQFLIITRDLPNLPRTNTIFGYVEEQTTLDSIEAQPILMDDTGVGVPVTPIRILSASVKALNDSRSTSE